MNNHYLKFSNQQETELFYKDIKIWNEQSQTPFTSSHTHSLDVIGQITVGGEWDENGNEIESPTTLEGYHVNYIGELPEKWKDYEVFPSTPYRVWF
jgi:hypothetical protein